MELTRVSRLRNDQSMMQDHHVTTLSTSNSAFSDESFLPGEQPDIYCLAASRDSRYCGFFALASSTIKCKKVYVLCNCMP
jgi:hypothetical protein